MARVHCAHVGTHDSEGMDRRSLGPKCRECEMALNWRGNDITSFVTGKPNSIWSDATMDISPVSTHGARARAGTPGRRGAFRSDRPPRMV